MRRRCLLEVANNAKQAAEEVLAGDWQHVIGGGGGSRQKGTAVAGVVASCCCCWVKLLHGQCMGHAD